MDNIGYPRGDTVIVQDLGSMHDHWVVHDVGVTGFGGHDHGDISTTVVEYESDCY